MHRQHVLSASTVLLVAANSLIPVAILIFATGFFPYKPFLPGLARYEDLGDGSPPDAPFDRLVFMVVDALRSDFVYLNGSGFEFTQSLINDGVAIPFTARATSPTITMPRIKAMTTGSTPSFLDAILSFDEGDTSSTLAVQDTWLAQMKAKDAGKLIMYGDDTWLKLFPGTFDRADGTSSFFVSDFTEVDNNVTRHIAEELRNDDWSTMVLHYLGLDHIGHKAGPRSPNMIPKQREMDGIVRQVYEAMETQEHLRSTLLIFCGDHGMNDAGNHGGSSPGETSAALVFVSPKLRAITRGFKSPASFVEDFQYYDVVEQSDLAPTLSALLGFPIPKNSLGAFIVDFLPFWSKGHDKFQILTRNARQILGIVMATLGSSPPDHQVTTQDCLQPASDAHELVCDWQRVSRIAEESLNKAEPDERWMIDVSKWILKAQSHMSNMASNYDIDRMTAGGAAATVATVMSIAVIIALSTKETCKHLLPFALITTLYGIMMFASSYVEEEQHFWYWTLSAWLAYLALRRMPRRTYQPLVMIGVGLLSVRLIRSWNQTGQKFAGEPDIVTMFIAPNPSLLWCLVLATYAYSTWGLYRDLKSILNPVSGSIIVALAISAISFKLAFTSEDAPELVVGLAKTVANTFDEPSLVARARAVFMCLGLTALYPLYLLGNHPTDSSKTEAMRALHHLYTIFALTQSRATNIPLFLLFRTTYLFLSNLDLDHTEITTSSILLQFASFFAMDGSNSFAGIDLSSAYNGVGGFNVVGVGALTFLSNWAAPVWWTSASNLLLLESRKGMQGGERDEKGKTIDFSYGRHLAILTAFTSVSLVFVMAACTALRTHLFIWTVFSPKYLYSMAWSLGQHLVINVGLGSLLFWLGL